MAAPGEIETNFRRHLLSSGHSPETARSYAANLRLFLRWCEQHEIDAAAAERPAIERYIEDCLAHLARNTVALRLAGLRAFYAFLSNGRDPTVGLIVKRELIAPRAPLSDAEIARVLRACRNDRDRLMLRLGLECGLRVSEVVGLRRRDLDLDNGLLLVRGKGARQRWVAIGEEMKSRLLAFQGGARGVLWWTRDRRPLTVHRAERNMEEIARRAGLPVHWHKLRTSFACRFLTATHDLDSLRTLMGHADANTTARYAAFGAQQRALDMMRQLQAQETMV